MHAIDRSGSRQGLIESLVLVSGSPRRRQLLEQLGVRFTVFEPNVDETPERGMTPEAYVRAIARRKMGSYIEGIGPRGPGRVEDSAPWAADSDADSGIPGDTAAPRPRWALAADTAVVLGRRIIGKPADREEAGEILRALSGRSHRVVTAVVLFNPLTRSSSLRTERTKVTFSRLSDEEIDWYLRSGEWQGVAGGYRIQERGSVLVRRIEGSYSNVVGLPIATFYGMVQAQGYRLFPMEEETIR